MAEPILDYESFFEGAKNALLELDTLSTEEQRLGIESERISKAIASEKKATNDRIADTTTKRLKEITSTYDSEIKKVEEQKKAVEIKKEKAKSKKIGERIADETRDLREHIKSIKSGIKQEMKTVGIPEFCNTGWYLTFYFPHKFSDYIKLLITVVVFFLGLPVLIYRLIPEHKPIYLPFIYFVIVLLIGGLYIIVGNLTKARYRDSLMKIRAMRDNIDHDMKRITLITKDINNDSADDRYDLSSFDAEIEAANDKLSSINEKRNAAISDFENNTKKIITDEITESSRERLDNLNSELEMTKKSLSSIADRRSQINLTISDKYESYLGRDFLNTERIEALQKLISDGEAGNISDAIDLYERRKNG
jgi:hypothetical protein